MCHGEKFESLLLASVPWFKPHLDKDAFGKPAQIWRHIGPQVAGEATSAMHDVVDLQQNDESGPSFDDLVSSLNVDQSHIFRYVKDHLEHQVRHESDTCKCSDWKPLHMFISGGGGTGKSEVWHDKTESLLRAVTAPTGLAAFNVGGVTIH